MNIDENLKIFEAKFLALKQNNYSNFSELELAYCKYINDCNQLRKFLVDNQELCDKNSMKVLTGYSKDVSLLSDKYKIFLSLGSVINELVNKYQNYVYELVKDNRFVEAINIYNQMYKLSNNISYKLEIANIFFKVFKDYPRALKLYKEIKSLHVEVENNYKFWWSFSEVYRLNKDMFNSVKCIQKACDIELKSYEVC